ncbi:MAG: hypothetical protein Q8M94_19885, partial [Ignavibacteria bacterium]|nr:hypothetical protein [Ignavibacteria bacterium]
TKGLVFNIPFFDEDDYHPIDSSFSLSIGKPLIPLRGVPFDNIYIPTSGYEYRRLIESKVEKIIGASEIAESEENFPTLVIDARSYNSNQVQLQWDDKSQTETSEQLQTGTESGTETQIELSDYEKQTKELKNIAWDFGEDLSRQIEEESILDITDERISMDLNLKANSNKKPVIVSEEITDIQELQVQENYIIPEKSIINETEFVEELSVEDSSEKLDELLESESNLSEPGEEELVTETVNDEIIIDEVFEEVKPDIIENAKIKDEISDKEFWESTSKYFEPYKPETQKTSEEEIAEVKSTTLNLGDFDSKENSVVNITEPEGVNMSIDDQSEDEISDENIEETKNKD